MNQHTAIPAQQPASGPQDRSEAIDFRELYRILRFRWRLALAAGLCFFAVVALVTLQLPQRFSATAQVLLDPRTSTVVNVEDVLSGIRPDASTMASEIKVLTSEELLRRVVRGENLVADSEFGPQPPGVVEWLRAALDPRPLLASAGMIAPLEVETAADPALVESRTAGRLAEAMTVSRDGLSYVITVAVTSGSAEKSARLANAIADAYIVGQLEARYEATRRASEWLNGRLAELGETLKRSEEAAQAYRTQLGIVGTGDRVSTLSEQQLSEINGKLVLARADVAQARAKLEQATQSGRRASADSISEVTSSPLIIGLRQQEAELQRRQADLSQRYTAEHPEMRTLAAERRDLAGKIRIEVDRIVQVLRNDLAIAVSREQALQKSLDEARALETTMGENQVRLRELEREAAANRAIYETFLQRAKETTESADLKQTQARVISAGVPPKGPSFPNVPLFLAGGLVLAGLVGAGAAIAAELLDTAVRSVHQLERTFGVRALALVPAIRGSRNVSRQIVEQPFSSFAEAFRGVLSALRASGQGRAPQTVLVTSALPHEGKTTCAVSLARLAAVSGLNTLLVDADLRRPAVLREFGVRRPETGLLEVTRDPSRFQAALMQDQDSPLKILTAHGGGLDADDLFRADEIGRLLDRLKAHFDLVVIDSSPILPVADSRALARVVDAVVMVVAWNATPRSSVSYAIELLRQHGAAITGAVLNKADLDRTAAYHPDDPEYYFDRYRDYYVTS